MTSSACSPCLTRGRAVCLLSVLLVLVAPGRAAAQFSEWWAVDDATTGSVINLAATWEGPELLQGVEVELSTGADLLDVAALRYGRDAVSKSTIQLDGLYQVRFEQFRRGPHELLLNVALPESGFDVEWRVTPVLQDGDGTPVRAAHLEQRGRIELLPPPRQTAGDAVEFKDGSESVVIDTEALPLIDYSAPFEVNLWLKTTSLDQVVLSTWSGSETDAYPLELVIGPAGRLYMYRGQPGRHEAISSRRPVADGRWHEVRVSFDGSTTYLHIDGVATDSTSAHFSAIDSPPSLVLGGRATPSVDTLRHTFVGWLDDLAISGRASTPDAGEQTVVVTFDDGISEKLLLKGSPRPNTVPSDRVRATPPNSLRATVQHGLVQLHWMADVAAGGMMLVERSVDGRRFDIVGQIGALDGDGRGTFQAEDSSVGDAVRYYRICHVLPSGPRLYTQMLKVGIAPEERETAQIIGNFPNPFSGSTTIAFRLTDAQDVEVSVWDLSGQQVDVLVDNVQPEGHHEVQFDASELPSGTYFVRLQTPTRQVSRKMIVAR